MENSIVFLPVGFDRRIYMKYELMFPDQIRKAIDAYIYKCSNCGAEYDEAKKGISFRDLPEEWKCEKCGSPKSKFEKIVN